MKKELTRQQYLDLYYNMRLNRAVEDMMVKLFRQNKIVGGLYSSLGQEAISVGTAYALEKKLSPKEIERRRKRLMQIQRQISKKLKKALVGKEFDLVLEGTAEETDLLLEGRTAMHAPEIDGKVFVNEFADGVEPEFGKFYRCEITEAHDYDLVARVL